MEFVEKKTTITEKIYYYARYKTYTYDVTT